MAKIAGIDASDFIKNVKRLQAEAKKVGNNALRDAANELMRLSSFEVPHDTGMLQASGTIEPVDEKTVRVGYNKVYAARLHEHPEYNFQKGRKGKYLEDPMKNNLSVFRRFIGQPFVELLK